MNFPNQLSVDGKHYHLVWGHSHLSISEKDGDTYLKVAHARLATLMGHMPLTDIIRIEINGSRQKTSSGTVNRSASKWQSHR